MITTKRSYLVTMIRNIHYLYIIALLLLMGAANPVFTQTIKGNVYGGGEKAQVDGNTTVTIINGTVAAGTKDDAKGDVYGGGFGTTTMAANVTGNTKVNLGAMVDDGEGDLTSTGEATVNNIFGCNNINGAPSGTATVNVISGTVNNNVYGGGNLAAATVAPSVNIKGGTVTESVYGGGYGATAVITGNPTVVVSGGVVTQSVFGGGSLANTEGATSVTVSGGTVTEDVYGGGALADVNGETHVSLIGGKVTSAYGGGLGQLADVETDKEAVAAAVTGTANITLGTIDGEGVKSGNCVVESIFGCNYMNGAPVQGSIVTTYSGSATNVYGGGNIAAASVSPKVTINGGSIAKDVFGGGYGTTAVIEGNPVVTVSDGTVSGDVYGGGALADVDGDTKVILTGGAVGGAYGGALGSAEVAAKVNGDTYVHLDGSKVTDTGIFGANNLNGTPTGHVKVHVTSTTPRDGQVAGEYDVPAVYGGGNLSAYMPSDENDYAEVLIENCDNSIEYVYGGGNAAPVPATQVTIYGANAINHAFAGGNGAGNGNPGADVGYLAYMRDEEHKYGSGLASITVTGGTVHNVYGGSNTLGYIRGGTSVSVQQGSGCPLNVGNVFGGGNEADIDCSVTINLDCNEGGAVLYAGANNANVNGDITLNINSGIFGKVFCGNNTGGKIFGSLQVNVDETSGCWPVMIGELYACGNMAPYSVYGYDAEGNCIETADKMTMDKPYNDPEINLISFTRIGKVFGGGYGETAVLYGNTHVNVDPIKGSYAGKTCTLAYVLNGDDERVPFAEATTLPYGIKKEDNSIVIPDEVGSIGAIYGGGNAGAVYGNTNVLIGTKTTNQHVSGSDALKAEIHDVAVTITGDVFGGGNEAIVSGDTYVKIGE